MAEPANFWERDLAAQGGPMLREETAQSKDLADLQAKYIDTQLKQLQASRLAQTPLPEGPKNIGQKLREQSVLKSGEALTGASTAARTKLPALADQAEMTFAAARELVEHPGFEATVGAPNPFKGGFFVGTFPGSRARDFSSKLTNVKAQAFTQAFETLKGAGAITEKEGQAATEALANLDTSVSEEQFKKNLQAYLDIIKRGYDRAQRISDIQPVPYSREMLLAEKQRRLAEKQRRAALKAAGQ